MFSHGSPLPEAEVYLQRQNLRFSSFLSDDEIFLESKLESKLIVSEVVTPVSAEMCIWPSKRNICCCRLNILALFCIQKERNP